MTLEVLEAYADAKVKIEKLEEKVKALSIVNKELAKENKRKVFIEDYFELSFDKLDVYKILNKEEEILEYLKELEDENS